MFIALTILLIIALFITVYYVKANKAGAAPQVNTTPVSGNTAHQPTSSRQNTNAAPNPGSVPDGSGHDKGQGGAAMSTGMQG